MVDLPLLQIHAMRAEHEDRQTENKKGKTHTMQQRVQLEVQQPTSGKHKSDGQGCDCDSKTYDCGDRLPYDRTALDSLFAHE
jgi:hypothetical protein